MKIQKMFKCIIILIYILENFYKNICTCRKSPAIDCQAFEDRPVDRDRLVGHPCPRSYDAYNANQRWAALGKRALISDTRANP